MSQTLYNLSFTEELTFLCAYSPFFFKTNPVANGEEPEACNTKVRVSIVDAFQQLQVQNAVLSPWRNPHSVQTLVLEKHQRAKNGTAARFAGSIERRTCDHEGEVLSQHRRLTWDRSGLLYLGCSTTQWYLICQVLWNPGSFLPTFV